MDSDHTGWQVLFLFLLIIANGIFSATEMAIVSAKKPRLEQMAEKNNDGAQAALDIAKDPNQLFSTIQIGITAIGIITGMLGAASLAEPLAEVLAQVPELEAYAAALSMFLIMFVVTFLTLIIGELVPKRVAVNSPEAISAVVARPMRLFAKLNKPLVWLLTVSTNTVVRMMGIKIVDEQPVTEEEIRFMLHQGARLGTFDKEEPELIDRIFRLNDIPAEYIMTARPQLRWLDLYDPDTELADIILNSPHTRLPVGFESLDDFRGIVDTQEILKDRLRYPQRSWHELIEARLRTPLYIPETLTLIKILELFRTKNAHEAIILDEYGALEGLVTLHDILEEIVGIMPGSVYEHMQERNKIIRRSANSWLVDGLLSIEEFKEFFAIHYLLPKEGEDYYKTLGGFVIYLFGFLPKETDTVAYRNFTFEVIDIDNYRVDKILVTKTEKNEEKEDII